MRGPEAGHRLQVWWNLRLAVSLSLVPSPRRLGWDDAGRIGRADTGVGHGWPDAWLGHGGTDTGVGNGRADARGGGSHAGIRGDGDALPWRCHARTRQQGEARNGHPAPGTMAHRAHCRSMQVLTRRLDADALPRVGVESPVPRQQGGHRGHGRRGRGGRAGRLPGHGGGGRGADG